MLKIDLKPGQSVAIGNATITLEEKSGKVARLVINADKSVPIQRIQAATPATIAASGLPGMAPQT